MAHVTRLVKWCVGNAEWLDKHKRQCLILWKKVSADLIAWVPHKVEINRMF